MIFLVEPVKSEFLYTEIQINYKLIIIQFDAYLYLFSSFREITDKPW